MNFPEFQSLYINAVVAGEEVGRKMAGNEWINGYLEAILDAGAASKPKPHQSTSSSFNSFSLSSPDAVELASGEVSPAPRFSPTRYFVEEVVSRFDDADLHKTWIKVL